MFILMCILGGLGVIGAVLAATGVVKFVVGGKIVIGTLIAAALGLGVYQYKIQPMLREKAEKTEAAKAAGVAVNKDGKPLAETVPVVANKGGNAAAPSPNGLPVTAQAKSASTCTDEVTVCLSQWPGHMAAFLACPVYQEPGDSVILTTKAGGFCSQVASAMRPNCPGVKIHFAFIETPVEKNVALQQGKCDFVWQTTDEIPVNMGGFEAAKVDPVSVAQIDWSKGGDGCVGTPDIKTPEDLVNNPSTFLKFSPEHTLFEFFINNGNLTPAKIAKARAGVTLSPDSFTAGKDAFCQGKARWTCLWQPDLGITLDPAKCQRPDGLKGHVFFSSADADTLIADNLFVVKGWAAQHPDAVEKVIRVFLKGGEIGRANPKAAAAVIASVVPRFRDELGLEGTELAVSWVRWNDLADNVAYFGLDGTAPKFDGVYRMAEDIYSNYTELDGSQSVTKRFNPAVLRDGSFIRAIYQSEMAVRAEAAAARGVEAAPIVRELPTYDPKIIAKAAPVLTKGVTINFDTGKWTLSATDRSTIKREVIPALDKTEGKGVRIEGNTDLVGNPTSNRVLSQKRADEVKAFLVSLGIPANRMVALGNGSDNPVPECGMSRSPDCDAANRRTEIKFVQASR